MCTLVAVHPFALDETANRLTVTSEFAGREQQLDNFGYQGPSVQAPDGRMYPLDETPSRIAPVATT